MLNGPRLDSAIFAPAKISSNSIRRQTIILSAPTKQVGTPLRGVRLYSHAGEVFFRPVGPLPSHCFARRQPSLIVPVMRCPECGSDEVQSLGKRNFPYPFALVAVIGASLALVHQASSPIDYHCPSCGLRFARRSARARFVLRFLIFGFAALVMFGVYCCASSSP